MIRSFRREAVDALFGFEGWHPELVIALGAPIEHVELVGVTDGDIRYYRLPDGTHRVPKRSLDEVILKKESGT